LFRNISTRLLFPTLIIFLSLLAATAVSAQTKLLRFPDIHADRVAFTYGGDIWTAPAAGGSAIRVTAHPGIEVFAKFSPDGKWVAFTASMTAMNRSMWSRQLAAFPANLRSIRAGPANTALGLGQPGLWLDQGWQTNHFKSLRDSWTLPIAHLYALPSKVARLRSCRCPKPVQVTIRLTAIAWSTRRSRATFAQRNVTAAAWRTNSTSLI